MTGHAEIVDILEGELTRIVQVLRGLTDEQWGSLPIWFHLTRRRPLGRCSNLRVTSISRSA